MKEAITFHKYALPIFALACVLIWMTGCGPAVEPSYESDSYKKYCNTKCEEKFGTSVDWVGTLSGTCFCNIKEKK